MRSHHRPFLPYLSLMRLPPLLRYCLWRGLVPVVFLAERAYLRLKRFDWGLFLLQMIGFLTIGACVTLICLLIISLSWRPVVL